MLPPRNRLRLTRDHHVAARRGVRGAGRLLVVHLVAGSDGSETGRPTRAGFVVGRTIGSATRRNAVRRRLRHLMRERLDRVPEGSLVVIRARAEAGSAASAALARDLDAALGQAVERGRR